MRQVGYHRLVADLEEPGCPACRSADRAAWRYLDGLLWEHVNDPEIRRRLRRDRGFCREHAHVAIAVARQRGDGLGMAIVYEDVLRALETELAALRSRRRRRYASLLPSRCGACDSAEQAAANALDVLATAAEGTVAWVGIRREGRGLCLPHLAFALERHPTEPEASRLIEAFVHGAGELRRELLGYIRKHDYRFVAQGFTDREASAWRRTVVRIVGGVEPPLRSSR